MSASEASSDRIVVVGRAQRGVKADVANLVLTVLRLTLISGPRSRVAESA